LLYTSLDQVNAKRNDLDKASLEELAVRKEKNKLERNKLENNAELNILKGILNSKQSNINYYKNSLEK